MDIRTITFINPIMMDYKLHANMFTGEKYSISMEMWGQNDEQQVVLITNNETGDDLYVPLSNVVQYEVG